MMAQHIKMPKGSSFITKNHNEIFLWLLTFKRFTIYCIGKMLLAHFFEFESQTQTKSGLGNWKQAQNSVSVVENCCC
jgi:hypothetical protein